MVLNWGGGGAIQIIGAGPAYTGPGDVASANGFTFDVWGGLRAYTAALASPSTKLITVHGAGGATQDIFCTSTGAINAASLASFISGVGNATTVGGVSCVYVDTIYDQTGNGFHMANTGVVGTKPVIGLFNVQGASGQASIGAYYQINFNNNSANNNAAGTMTTATNPPQSTAIPGTLVIVGNNTYNGIIDRLVTINTFDYLGSNAANTWALNYSGGAPYQVASTTDGYWHAAVGTIPQGGGGGTLTFAIDGTSHSPGVVVGDWSNNGPLVLNSGSQSPGLIVEFGFRDADISAFAGALNSNMHNNGAYGNWT